MTLPEGPITKGGHNPPNTSNLRPPPPQGSNSERLRDLERLLILATETRIAQKIYFQTHGGLDHCKRLERTLDQQILELTNSHQRQPRLF